MDIKEKMELCLNEELEKNEVLTVNEKKVLAALMYSYKICKMAKDGQVIRSMTELRKDVKMDMNKLYDSLRNLEELYGMIERVPGQTRKQGEKSTASLFKLHFDKILNPPKEKKKFDFSNELKAPGTPINKANTNTKANINTDTNTEVNTKTKPITNEKTNATVGNKIGLNYKKIEESIKQDELLKDEIKKQFESWSKKVNEQRQSIKGGEFVEEALII